MSIVVRRTSRITSIRSTKAKTLMKTKTSRKTNIAVRRTSLTTSIRSMRKTMTEKLKASLKS